MIRCVDKIGVKNEDNKFFGSSIFWLLSRKKVTDAVGNIANEAVNLTEACACGYNAYYLWKLRWLCATFIPAKSS
jgi:hypothetical protein